ncbi:hypothetical protein EMIHUDRAFT_231645 [Emiliania huxleyi CCMP1516]|uniref:ADF-H domain-containing protein n=2 Tax=Emiliania huxleyi TaxID=2903 RepID=A0A0D3K7B9_EMIH1|nr:hypothetical protein EMIHUDRAFT_231645 [Emiliania huxleyi CCMP1516]EOD31654.1 hypothetical protein EMIHUDRAFT_231645 [Emiliania huxleyi CCMP1516]|eukprot:XP_005784083.1 hypothetical protein EMIHUDRAFT_231645 [Emiliania huxleyi CCMP1516]
MPTGRFVGGKPAMPKALSAEELQEMDNEDRLLYVRIHEKGDEAERARFVIYAPRLCGS